MQAFSELTLEKAADLVASRVVLSSEIGTIKVAFTQPKDLAQALQWAFVPGSQPTVATAPGATPITDPGWGTINKALLGAGIGLGGGALVSALDKKKRKNWLRNALMGGMLGGGIGGGLGALGHYGEALSSPDATTAPAIQAEQAQGTIDQKISRGEDVTPEDRTARDSAEAATPQIGDQMAPLDDRLLEAGHQLGKGNIPNAAGTLFQSSAGGIAGAAMGGVAGAAAGEANQQRIAKLENNHESASKKFDSADAWTRLSMMPEAEWKKNFGADAGTAKKELLAQRPVRDASGVLKPITPKEMFPDLAGRVGPPTPELQRVQDTLFNDPTKGNAVMQSINTGPKKPLPRIRVGPRVGGVAGGLGGLATGAATGLPSYNAAARTATK